MLPEWLTGAGLVATIPNILPLRVTPTNRTGSWAHEAPRVAGRLPSASVSTPLPRNSSASPGHRGRVEERKKKGEEKGPH